MHISDLLTKRKEINNRNKLGLFEKQIFLIVHEKIIDKKSVIKDVF